MACKVQNSFQNFVRRSYKALDSLIVLQLIIKSDQFNPEFLRFQNRLGVSHKHEHVNKQN